ncbi:MAG: class I SAM-dependent DNA methyltransferase [Coprobacillaceae bacterium]
MSYESFAYYYDSLMDEQFYIDYHNFIKQHAKFKTVLELGCGTGEIAIRLAKDDTLVYATDISKDMLEVSRLKAMNEDVNLLLGRVDMTDFSVDTTVDLVLCLCDSINYILDKKKVKQTLKNCYNALHDKGTFIFDVDSLYKMNVVLKDYHEESDDDEFYFQWKVDSLGHGKVAHYIDIIDKVNNEHVKEEHIQQTYSVEEYIQLLKEVGFQDIKLYSDFYGYQENCERVIFVCKKEK